MELKDFLKIKIAEQIPNNINEGKRDNRFLAECDLSLDLRICGYGEPRYKISVDDGDGFSFLTLPENGTITENIKKSWINQLKFIISEIEDFETSPVPRLK